MKKLLQILAIFFAVNFSAEASHIVGGEFQLIYRQKGYNYSLNMNLYFDDINAGSLALADNIITVAIYDKTTDNLMMSVQLNRISLNEFVPYLNPDCQFDSLRTRIIRYSSEITLDPNIYNSNDGYYVVFDRCCRNQVITNIVDPDQTGMMFYMEFPAVSQGGNRFIDDTPVFTGPFAEYACVGQPFWYDFSATDRDGDSLVYLMVDPYNGNQGNPYMGAQMPFPHAAPFASVTWQPSFSATNAVPGAPAMSINPQTGILGVTPTMTGLFVFSVLCEEYRNGVKIGAVKRDYQILVRPPCDPNEPPKIDVVDQNGGQIYVPGDTLIVTDTTNHCYDIIITDSIVNNQESNVTILVEASNFDNNYITLSQTGGLIQTSDDSVKVEVCWEQCFFPPDSTFKIDIFTEDDGCPIPLVDTLEVFFKVVQSPNTDPVVTTSLSVDTVQLQIWHDTSFTVFGSDADNDQIFLTGNGVGYSFGDVGMNFANVEGAGNVQSDFSWRPDCEHLEQEYFQLQFSVDDKYCNTINDSTIFKWIRVYEVPVIEIVVNEINVFTPNGDGINDFYELPDLPEERCGNVFSSVAIYNRWGQRVFYDENKGFKWDGSGVGEGTYYYYITYDQRVYKGWLQIMR